MTALVEAGFVLGTIATAFGIRMARRGKSTFGSKIWASVRDADRGGVTTRGSRGGAVLGVWPGGRIMRFDGPEHTLIAGPSRSGKTAGVVIPSLLSNTNSVVVYDPKRELWDITGQWRSTVSDAFYLDFTDEQSACFNPLDVIRVGSAHEISDTQNIVSVLVDPGGSKGDLEYWDKDASQLLFGLILFVLHGPGARKNLATVRNLLLDIQPTLAVMAASSINEVAKIGRSYGAMADRQLSAVKSTAD